MRIRAIAAVVCLQATTFATDWFIYPGDSIQNTIAMAAPGDRILAHPGVYDGVLRFQGKDIELLALAGATHTTIDASGWASPAVSFRDGESQAAMLSGFTVIGSQGQDGGCVYILNSSPTISGCILRDGRRLESGGGGVYCANGSPSITDCVITNNHGNPQGGGLYFLQSSLLMTECTILGNTSSGAGAGIYLLESDASLENCEIRDHGSSGNGAGIYAVLSQIQLTSSDILENSAVDGGGLFASGTDVSLVDCSFRDNNAGNWGGAIYLEDGNITVDATAFENNSSFLLGGACYLSDTDGASITECDFVANDSRKGGAAYLVGPPGLIEGSSFVDNVAEDEGAALRLNGGVLADCFFSGNRIGFFPGGGAVEVATLTLDVIDCTFVGNDGWRGAAINAPSSQDLTVHNSRFLDNGRISGGPGRAICMGRGALTNCLFAENGDPAGASAAVCMDSPTPVPTDVLNCTFAHNAGPAIENTGLNPIIRNSISYYNNFDVLPSFWSVTYSNTENVHPGVGNISTFPMFVDAPGGNYDVRWDSPCIDAGDPSDPPDPDGSPADIGARFGPFDCNGDMIPDGQQLDGNDCNFNQLPDECDVAEADCNGNLIPDDCDIADGTSLDLDQNGVPDECQPDCNGNSLPDFIDLFYGTSLDCNQNGIPDECDIQAGSSTDCNGNGTPDECDVPDGFSLDCNGNGLPDECEADCNGNGVPDDCDIASGFSQDLDGNGFPDECKDDCNGNGVPDYIDLFFGASEDCNGNGVPDECEPDCNGNGVADECDITSGTSMDQDGNGVPDECDCGVRNYCVTAPNSAGPGALISASGTTSITANDLVLQAAGCPPSQFGIFFYGPDQTLTAFGDGFLCVAGQVFRLPVVSTDALGDTSYALDYTNPPEPAGEILAGSSWNFQFWYRDGATFNLSDGLSAAFCP